MMLSERFSRLFGSLLTRWVRYQDASRDPALVTDLAAARVALDEVRSDIADERSRLTAPKDRTIAAPRFAVSDSDLSRLRVAAIGLGSN